MFTDFVRKMFENIIPCCLRLFLAKKILLIKQVKLRFCKARCKNLLVTIDSWGWSCCVGESWDMMRLVGVVISWILTETLLFVRDLYEIWTRPMQLAYACSTLPELSRCVLCSFIKRVKHHRQIFKRISELSPCFYLIRFQVSLKCLPCNNTFC